jgi:2,3-bisphosphoglycerate-independent phosphoglycerate mutase
VRSIVVLLLDGLGDRASEAHGGRTANEAAWTPCLDAHAAGGSCGLLWPLGPGRAPSSEVAHWAMLGYAAQESPGRAVMEALGHGQEVDAADVLAFASLRLVERRGGELWATGGPAASDGWAAQALADAAPPRSSEGLDLSVAPLGPPARPGEGILRVAGGGHDAVTDTDPFLRDRQPVMRPVPLVPEAEATARAAEDWSRAAVRRAGDGGPLTAVTLKWWGRLRPAPAFADRHGLEGLIVGASPFLAGLARALGMAFVHAPEDPADPAAALRDRIGRARRAVDDGATFVLCHLKAPDEAGHTKDPRTKRETIEALDTAFRDCGDRLGEVILCVTGDHATPTDPEVIHSGDPVPFLLSGPGVRADRVERFGELDFGAGLLGRITGRDVMPLLLNAADRPLYMGSRPTPVSDPAGVPAAVEPLLLDEPPATSPPSS